MKSCFRDELFDSDEDFELDPWPELPFKPFCPSCGGYRPYGRTESMCVPCADTGHSSRLVLNESDRQHRISNWAKFYREQGFTEKDLRSIPFWLNLNTK